MRKYTGTIFLFILLGLLLGGCGRIGSKAADASVIYGAATVFSVFIAAAYIGFIREKNKWFTMLFSSVFIVNSGYLMLSVSETLEHALWANRISYLGSVFLPLAMLMIITNVCRLQYSKLIPALLIAAALAVFAIAASPGYLDIYYKSVALSSINGATVLEKVYGPWHQLYLFYLLAYFVSTVAVLFHSIAKRRIESAIHALFIGAALFVNMGVWLVEQLVRVDFELLSVSYIVSELFLLMLCLMMQSSLTTADSSAASSAAEPETTTADAAQSEIAQYAHFSAQLATLTPTERTVYNMYIEGKSTKEIMSELNIKENTLKFHNKNLYGKLGVTSRKQLIQISAALNDNSRD